ncbi:MAG: PDZ domain-containing protein, partial [Candidatus Spechtbacteria bacterium]|nr:PDZ domain-containing protein [Candidatus Spechtbacteria bacterium]
RGETVTDLAVVPGSAADKAGIAENDIILEIDGQKITQDNTPTKVIQQHSVGDTITLKFLHKGEEKSAQAVLGER